MRTLMAWLRGKPRVCSMVRVPTVEDEDRRRIVRERERLEELRTGAGLPMPVHLRSRIGREPDWLELLIEQIKVVETERGALCAEAGEASPQAMLKDIRGIGAEFASTPAHEGPFRKFDNRRPDRSLWRACAFTLVQRCRS